MKRRTKVWQVVLAALVLGSGTASSQDDLSPLEELLVDLGVTPGIERALRWRYFIQGGYQDGDTAFQGAGADDVAVAGALQGALQSRLQALIGDPETVTLGGYRRVNVVKFDEASLELKSRTKSYHVPFAQVEQKEWAALLRKQKGKGDQEQTAIAVLAALAGDRGNVRKAQAEVKDVALAEALGRWLEGCEALQTEIQATELVDTALGTEDAQAFVEHLDASWPAVRDCELAQKVTRTLKTRYLKDAFTVWYGAGALEGFVHGKVEASGAPADENAPVEVKLTYEFDDAAELEDFQDRTPDRAMLPSLKYMNLWWSPPDPIEAFTHVEGKLRNSAGNLTRLSLPFSEVTRIELHAIIDVEAKQEDFNESFLAFGLEDPSSLTFLIAMNLWRLIERRPTGIVPSAHRDMQWTPGKAHVVVIDLKEGTSTLERDGETLATLRQAVCRRGHFFLAGGGKAMWNVDRVVLEGAVQPVTLRNLARTRADAAAKALFGDG